MTTVREFCNPFAKAADRPDASRRNVRWLMIGFLCSLATMVVTLAVYQLTDSPEADALYTHQTVRLANIPAERGALLSCEGDPLLWSRPVYRFVLDVRSIRHPREEPELTVTRIETLLARFAQKFDSGPMSRPMSREAIRDKLEDRGPVEFVLNDEWDASPADVARYAAFRNEFPQITLAYRFRRDCSIEGPLVNVLGKVKWKHPEEPKGAHLWYRQDEMTGASGLEASLDEVICGKGGTEQILVDVFGLHRVGTLERTDPVAGASVRLTFQMPIQRLAERCFLETGQGAFVVMEVGTNKVRAMGSAPFAPYAPTPEEFEELKKRADEGVFLDRARRSVQPPGSVFKPITVAAALMSGAMSATDEVYCDGLCRLGGRARPRECAGHHGQVDAAHCLAYSCNVFAYQAARRAGAETVVAWAKRFGIGNDPATRKYGLWTAPSHVMESKKWPLGEVYNLAIGKGSTGASLVSLAVYGGALVTDKVMAPLYVEEDSLPQAIQAKLPVRKVRTVGLRPEVRATILEGMLGCTEWSRGTGRSARLSGVRILAKTGTAQFKDGHKNATMLALVPAEAPKYSIVCTIENTELHGGSEVGPRLRKFLEGMVAQGYLSSSVVNGGE